MAHSSEEITISAYRALSGDVHGDVKFSAMSPEIGNSAKRLSKTSKKITARLPAPIADEPLNTQPHVRGAADSVALYRKYHDDALSINGLNTPDGQAMFDVLEQARCEALGALSMNGVGNNIAALIESSVIKKGYDREGIDISIEDSLYATAFSALTGHGLHPVSAHTANQIMIQIETMFDDNAFAGLQKTLNNQSAFAKESEKFIRHMMGLEAMSGDESNSDTAQDSGDSGNAGDNDQDNTSTETAQGDGEGQQSDDAASTTAVDMDENSDTAETTAAGTDDATSTESMGDDASASQRPNIPIPKPDPFAERLLDYHIYTTEFDEVITPSKLTNATELSALRAQLDTQLQPLQTLIGKLANRLQRRLMAQQQRRWQFDAEDGILNSARLARIIADPNLPLTYKREIQTEFKDTVLTLLIDNSGSMRGRPITVAALSADILVRVLERVGVKVEILGFTTANWKGGQSRAQWTTNGRPPAPGRLNDIRHIIYKDADAPLRRVRNNLGLMLKEGVLKENIDGEALIWAYKRLQSRREDRKILMVISDGAPVDDSTLSANRSGYLESELHRVIAGIEGRGDVELTAIGIGHDVGKYYKRAVTIRDAADLPTVMMNELAMVFDG
jgi:cobaltochelatase CobT